MLFSSSDPPEPPLIYGYTEGAAIKVGHSVTMTCRAIGGNPVATIAWYKGNYRKVMSSIHYYQLNSQ